MLSSDKVGHGIHSLSPFLLCACCVPGWDAVMREDPQSWSGAEHRQGTGQCCYQVLGFVTGCFEGRDLASYLVVDD